MIRRGQELKPALTPEQQVQVCERLEAGPTPADEVCSLRGIDVQRILAEEFGVLRSLAAVYHLLHRLGYSYLTPRPRHRRSNPAAQEQFKRELPARLQVLRSKHVGNACEFIFKMSRALASTERRRMCGQAAARARQLWRHTW
jgi:hypothetical protein